MKARLVTNATLAALIIVLQVIGLAVMYKGINFHDLTFSVSTALAGGALTIIGSIVMPIPLIIMGIVTLAMQKSTKARGLTIASGVLSILALLSILPFIGTIISLANLIVSWIAAVKAKA